MQHKEVFIRKAQAHEASIVVEMIRRLLDELGGFEHFEVETAEKLCRELLQQDHFVAFLAFDAEGQPLGVATLFECIALYMVGKVGWLQELYVMPEARSFGVGHRLLEAVNEYARAREYRRIEVHPPETEAWPRTVAFYRREGFVGDSLHLKKYV